jgi:hypothetical protein
MYVNYYNEKTQTLTIPYEFNDELCVLPSETQCVIFEENLSKGKISKFNQSVDNNLPPNLTHLTFGGNFNQTVDNLPSNLIHLTFGYTFNQFVNKLPINLTHLTFGVDFNQIITNYPPNLTHLKFGHFFDQSVDNLPVNLTHLTFGHDFNQTTYNIKVMKLFNNDFYKYFIEENKIIVDVQTTTKCKKRTNIKIIN